jgi:hypothetical protein
MPARMTENQPECTYKKRQGNWVPVDDPDSAAKRVGERIQSITWANVLWTKSHTINSFDKKTERQEFEVGHTNKNEKIIWCSLKNEEREFGVVSSEGLRLVASEFQLRIAKISGDEIEGGVAHHPRYESKHDGEVFEENFSWRIGLPDEDFNQLWDGLRRGEQRLNITLSLLLWKPQMEDDFDEYWMHQAFYLEEKGISSVRSFTTTIAEGPGLTELINAETETVANSEVQTVDPSLTMKEAKAENSQVVIMDPRLTWVLWLLIALVAVTLLK